MKDVMDEIDLKEQQEREEKNQQIYADLVQKSIDDQAEYFTKSFFFELGEEWKEVNKLKAAFKKACKENGSQNDLSHIAAAQFLQANGAARTGLERKRELRDIDMNTDGKVSFIEYLMLHYKVMILTSYYKRLKKDPEEDLSNGGIGLTGVGVKLLDELCEIPLNLDPIVIENLEKVKKMKKDRAKKILKLEKKIEKGGVMGKAAKNELEQFLRKGDMEIKKLEAQVTAARKKNLKRAKTASKALKAEKAKDLAAEKEVSKARKASFAARAAMFNK
mmetsp:Transcript_14376/g.17240  ORF Transcript_14376/g.17240 Transcript_14376/m.17240 type:complete len:276 (+) Transcript_14376:66-893(+)